MARSLNKVILIGNLTRDPLIRYTAKGSAVASFAVATNRSWVPTDGGEKVDEVEYHNITIFGKLAEIAEKYLKKGDKAYFEGRLKTNKWQGEDGKDRYTTEVVVEDMLMLGGSGGGASYDDDDTGPAPTAKRKSSKQESESQVTEVEDISDDIPF